MSDVVPGWYPDNSDATRERWWDGLRWTEHTRPLVGALPPAPPAPALARKRSRAGLFVGIGVGAFVLLVVGIAVSVALLVRTLGGPTVDDADTATFDPATIEFAPQAPDASWEPWDDAPLEGMASDLLASERERAATDAFSPADCLPLDIIAPVDLDDTLSTDLVGSIETWMDAAATASVSGSIRVFETPDAAAAYLATTADTVAACSAGYGSDVFATESVQPRVEEYDGLETVAWTEQGSDDSGGWGYRVVDLQRGNAVVRGTCLVSTEAFGASPCSGYFDTLAERLLAAQPE
jgi:hypothetical protein